MPNDIQTIHNSPSEYTTLYSDVRAIIDNTRQQLAAAYTNYQLIMYWNIGTRINNEILGGKRANYGAQIVSTLSTQLRQQYGDEYIERNLRRMMQFAQEVDQQIKYLEMDKTGIRVAHYYTELPPPETLQQIIRHHMELASK